MLVDGRFLESELECDLEVIESEGVFFEVELDEAEVMECEGILGFEFEELKKVGFSFWEVLILSVKKSTELISKGKLWVELDSF